MCSYLCPSVSKRCLMSLMLMMAMVPMGVESIRCWVCRSDSDPKCADPFDNTTLPITDCDIVTLPHLKSMSRTLFHDLT